MMESPQVPRCASHFGPCDTEYLEAIGSFYLDFHQVGDEEVRELPNRAAPLQKHPHAPDAT